MFTLHSKHHSQTQQPTPLLRLAIFWLALRATHCSSPVPGPGWGLKRIVLAAFESAQHRYVDGRLQRSKKPQQVRGLNQDHNHEMKVIFKSTATSATHCAGPFYDFYANLLAKGMKPEMARLTLARKIAAITLTLWKKGGRFDAGHLKLQAA
jgi:hypothetical protein